MTTRYLLAHLVLERPYLLLRRRAFDLLAGAEDVLDFLRERCVARAAADEAGDTRRVAHHVPRVVVEGHAHEQVAGEHLLLHDDLATALELDDVLHRDDDLVDALLDVHGLHPAGEVLLHLVLVARVRVHDEPVTGAVVGARLTRTVVLALGFAVELLAVDVDLDDLEQLRAGKVGSRRRVPRSRPAPRTRHRSRVAAMSMSISSSSGSDGVDTVAQSGRDDSCTVSTGACRDRGRIDLVVDCGVAGEGIGGGLEVVHGVRCQSKRKSTNLDDA